MLRAGLLRFMIASKKSFFFHLMKVTIILLILNLPTLADDTQEDLSKINKQAEKLKRKGYYEEAEKLFRVLLEKKPQDSQLKLKLAFVLMKQRRFVEAYDVAFPVAKSEPKNSYAFAVLGNILLGAGNFREANACLINALVLNKKEDLAWAGLGLLDFYENRLQESIQKLNNAVFLEPDEPDYIFSLAQVSARAEKYKEAADYYRQFLEMAPPADLDRRERIRGLMNFLRYIGDKSKLYVISGEKKTVVPIRVIRERPVIQVSIGKNKEPLNFVLDTGSGISVISEQTAERLKIKAIARGGKARGIGGEGKFEIVYGFLPSVTIGQIKIGNVPVYIRKFHAQQEDIDGYIGLAMISKFFTTIDYSSLQFSLTSYDEQQQSISQNSNSFNLRLTPSGYLSGEVQIEGIDVPLNFIIDTGASISVISDELARMEPIRQYASQERLRVIGAAGVTDNVPSYILPRVSFANQSRENIKAIVLDLDMINETAGFHQAGILGGNFLKYYRLSFDFVGSKIYLEPIDSNTSAKN